MSGEMKQVGEQRWRETFGRYYEDFGVGDVYDIGPAGPSPRPTIRGSRC